MVSKSQKSKKEKKEERKTDKTVESVEDRAKENKEKAKVQVAKSVENNTEPCLLNIKEVLQDRFEVTGILGKGGFAQVYLAFDKVEKQECAVKIEPKVESKEKKRMKLEIMVLTLLRAHESHVPELMAYGTTPTGQYIVMGLVGKNLSEIRRNLPGKKLTKKTLYRTMKQIATAMRSVHEMGFLHRDLKPSNFCIGTKDHTRIYLLDFGLARQYVTGAGLVRKARDRVGIRGTIRYLSLPGHEGMEYGPYTDLIAYVYSTIELGCGGLPWSKLTKEPDIMRKKSEISVDQLCAVHKEMTKLSKYVFNLDWNTVPDYNFIMKEVGRCIPANTTKDDLFDWETHKLVVNSEIAKDVINFNGTTENEA